jgi:hypothetical protein
MTRFSHTEACCPHTHVKACNDHALALQAEYAAAVDAFTAHRKGLEELLEEHDEAYLDLLRVPGDRGTAASTQVQPSQGGMSGYLKIPSRLWRRN